MSTRGERIRAARDAKGLSRSKVARVLDKDASTVFRWETQDSNLSSDDLDRLCELLGVTPNWVLRGDDPSTQAS